MENKKGYVEVISILGEHGNGDLWFDTKDPETPRILFDYIMDNFEHSENYEIKITNVLKEDFDREE